MAPLEEIHLTISNRMQKQKNNKENTKLSQFIEWIGQIRGIGQIHLFQW